MARHVGLSPIAPLLDGTPPPMASKPAFPATELFELLQPAKVWQGAWEDFRHRDQEAFLRDLQERSRTNLNLRQAGRSAEGRALWTITLGNGPRKVLAWARQHGDEPDCTAALNTVLDWLLMNPTHPVAARILAGVTLKVFPMVNPDGVARFTRVCAVGIDLNRDAVALATPEGRTLKELRDTFKPQFGLNLHDMNPRKRNGEGNLVAMAYQAGPFENADTDNEVRLRAKAVIAEIVEAVNPWIKGHIARYTADYMHRAFGDSMMRWGVASILIESGGWREADGGIDHVRRWHALSILAALDAVARRADDSMSGAVYETLPFDDGRQMFDVLLRGGELIDGAAPQRVRLDIGINSDINTTPADATRRFRGHVENLGDLEDYFGKVERKLDGCLVVPGLVGIAPSLCLGTKAPTAEQVLPYLGAGVTTLAASFGPFASTRERDNFLAAMKPTQPPLNIIALEQVATVDEVLVRQGMTDLAGLSVAHLKIAAIDLAEFVARYHPAAERESRPVPMDRFYGLNIVFRGGSSPRHSRLHLNLSDIDHAEAHRATRVELSQLRGLVDCYLHDIDQLSYSVTGSTRLLEPYPITDYPVGLGAGAPDEFFLEHVMAPCGEGVDGLLALASLLNKQLDRIFRIARLGDLRLNDRADVIAIPEALLKADDDKMVRPEVVVLNGEIVVDRAAGLRKAGRGMWFFAEG